MSQRRAHVHNLPAPRTRLIGREQDATAVRQAVLDTLGRLITLTGVGGCGKTRLALHVAADLLGAFRDGVWLVELSPVTDQTSIPQLVASVFGVREQPGRPITDTLVARLKQRQLLLVLDNCEHVVEATSSFADTMLTACPDMRLLATSREPLQVDGEITWRVPSLLLPALERLSDPDALACCPAVRLFVERAQAVQRGFDITPQNASAVGQICVRLGGIPLAIELAAARVGVLGVEQILKLLDDSSRLLVRGSRTAPGRQQTLRATLDWSHALLEGLEPSVFRRLAVFAGGWSLDAAEAVCSGDGVAKDVVMNVLGRLVDKSLVVAEEHDGHTRYRLLEPVRQYAMERLESSGEAERAMLRHAEYYLWFAESGDMRSGSGRYTPQQLVWLAQVELEQGNLRGALAWSRAASTRVEMLLRLTAALTVYWVRDGHLKEGQHWLESALATSGEAPTFLRAQALCDAAQIVYTQGDYERARVLAEESVAAYRRLGDSAGLAFALQFLGLMAGYRGDFAASRRWLNESLALYREGGNDWGTGMVMLNLGKVARTQGSPDEATTFLDQALPSLRRARNFARAAEALIDLSGLATERGDVERASALAVECLHELHDRGITMYLADGVELLAGVAMMREQVARAGRLFAAAEAARTEMGAERQPGHAALHARQLATVRATLDAAAFEAAWAAGRKLGLDEAVTEALATEERIASADPGRRPLEVAQSAKPLTRRELEVAGLIARGLTDRQIAEDLVITTGTAGNHVVHILDKLGFRSRAQVAAWVVEHGLLQAWS
jgi:predicted ATPase/DNA-binding NarL/FixJ family response regulator